MFKLIIIVLVANTFATPTVRKVDEAEPCNPDACKLPNCLCASLSPPGNLTPSQIPQFVVATFNGAITVQNIKYYREAFDDRKNPNDCPVSATYFATHEYTDYSLVHELWRKGHEIALNSITHQSSVSYWQNLDVEGYKKEFLGQRKLITHFANISRISMTGIRIPSFGFQNGDNRFLMIQESDLQYDSSCIANNELFFPYTLDYKTPSCASSSIPGVWEMPITPWLDDLNMPCVMIDSCVNIPEDEEGLLNFMKRNFFRYYSDEGANRSPFGIHMHSAWFGINEINFKTYLRFLDYLGQLDDVYIVSEQIVLEWVKNPTPSKEYKKTVSCAPIQPNGCLSPKTCRLMFGTSERYMTVCSETCPDEYPWINNPLGNAL